MSKALGMLSGQRSLKREFAQSGSIFEWRGAMDARNPKLHPPTEFAVIAQLDGFRVSPKSATLETALELKVLSREWVF